MKHSDKPKPRLKIDEPRTRRRITPAEIEQGLGAERVRNPYLTAHEALEMAEGMSDGEYAQLQIAADILGLDYGDFIDKLAKEHFASLKKGTLPEPHSDE